MVQLSFDKIYTAYSRLVYWAAYKVIPHRETAEDITQSVFEKVLANGKKLSSFEEPQLKVWLYRVATNLALDIARKGSKEQLNDAPLSEEIPDASSSPEETIVDKHCGNSVRRAINELSEIYRQVIILHYFSEMTVQEISKSTGISEGTIKSRLVRARALLAKTLENEVVSDV